MTKLIKTQEEYDEILSEIEELFYVDPDDGTDEFARLELLTLLIQDYENREISFDYPDPVEAIKFRMEQQDLEPRDLIPYIGSRSKVSEVLNQKRPLALSMIRALTFGLGIPAKVLLQEQNIPENEIAIDWNKFPVKELIKRNWISVFDQNTENALKQFLSSIDTISMEQVLLRKTTYIRSERKIDEYALVAWVARILSKTSEKPLKVDYKQNSVDINLMRELARLSVYEDGPIRAQQFLLNYGIHLIIEKHLPRTHLDGAAIMIYNKNPVIGLTLRFDRIDNFWFTLMHELAHLSLHFEKNIQFFDDLELDEQNDIREIEADELAGEALIPNDVWKKSPASIVPASGAAISLADELNIHPGIVAGRIRREHKAYRLLNNLVGHNQVRKLFTDVIWEV